MTAAAEVLWLCVLSGRKGCCVTNASVLVCFMEVICVAEMGMKVSDYFISTGLQ